SMMEQMPDGMTRAKAAMATFDDLIHQLPDGTRLGVRVFGHRGGPNCASELILPVQPLDREQARAAVNGVRVSSLGNTSIAEALDRVPEDLKDYSGVRRVVVLTDGEETCRGDPAASIANLAAAGIDTRVSIVGFEIQEERIRKSYTEWVQAGGGRYYDASSVSSLTRALAEALTPEQLPRFEILDDSMRVVASGQVGAGPVEVPSGAYRIRMEGDDNTERYGLIQAFEETVKLQYP
ncbi:MAG: VWA domain-containing protein, partial [Opitutales bacterium]|nr:VWA domain-containing protein [Opitutales bacterium]